MTTAVNHRLRVGLVQMCSGLEPADNIAEACRMIRRAAEDGARFVTTPEMTNILEPRRTVLPEKLHTERDDPGIVAFADLARELDLWLCAGSFALLDDEARLVNRSLLFSPTGEIAARYDKIHLFDVELPNGERFRELASYEGGRAAVVAKAEGVQIGLSICYDLRFPQLYLALARAGATVLNIPSAFTAVTGAAHWHVLMRARAIETGTFVLAAAQTGLHESGRETYGHSIVINPWGRIIAEADEGPGILVCDIDLGEVDVARARIPTLRHERRDVVCGWGELHDQV